MAQSALMELSAARVRITPEIVLWVQDAALKLKKQCAHDIGDLVDWPMLIGGATLYPATFGAIAWLRKLPEHMRNDARVIAYAMAHARQPDKLQSLKILEIINAVNAWCESLTCSIDALIATVEQMLGGNCLEDIQGQSRREIDAASTECGGVIRALCMKYPGTSMHYWLWDVSRDKCAEMLKELQEELPESHRVSDYEIEANIQFRAIIDHIKATCGGENGE